MDHIAPTYIIIIISTITVIKIIIIITITFPPCLPSSDPPVWQRTWPVAKPQSLATLTACWTTSCLLSGTIWNRAPPTVAKTVAGNQQINLWAAGSLIVEMLPLIFFWEMQQLLYDHLSTILNQYQSFSIRFEGMRPDLKQCKDPLKSQSRRNIRNTETGQLSASPTAPALTSCSWNVRNISWACS